MKPLPRSVGCIPHQDCHRESAVARPARVPLEHGDIVVWGGPARLRYHGVLPLKSGHHASIGSYRINLTFRKAG